MSEKEMSSLEKAPLKEKAAAKPAKEKKRGGLGKWFAELRSEVKKIRWPSFKQVVNNTLVVIASVLVIGGIIWIFDFLLGLANTGLRGLL